VFLEIIKPSFGEGLDRKSYDSTIELFERLCQLLHPFMPFITEEIWHQLRERNAGEDCMIAPLQPADGEVDEKLLALMEHLLIVKTGVLELRNLHQLSPKENMELAYESDPALAAIWSQPGAGFVIQKLSNATVSAQAAKGVAFLAGNHQYQALLTIEVEKKLSNEKFVAGAPVDVVEKERQKKADGEAKIEQLLRSLETLN
jgi:valyl-tRNA synthetase